MSGTAGYMKRKSGLLPVPMRCIVCSCAITTSQLKLAGWLEGRCATRGRSSAW